MRGLAHNQYLSLLGTQTVDLGWQHELASGGRINHWLTYEPPTALTTDYPPPLLLRVLCHYLVDSVPEEGVSELAENVVSIFDYYRVPRKSAVFAAQREKLPGEVLRTYTSPGFSVEDE